MPPPPKKKAHWIAYRIARTDRMGAIFWPLFLTLGKLGFYCKDILHFFGMIQKIHLPKFMDRLVSPDVILHAYGNNASIRLLTKSDFN